MSSRRKSTQYEMADTLTFTVSQFSATNTPRKLLSDKKRDPLRPDVLWRLKVYPNGNGTPGFLALYIDIPSKHALPEDWSCSREITFTLHHPTDPSKSIFKRTSHVFNDDEPDWGYNQIIPVVALSQRGFLQNDSIKVTATFRSADAPHEDLVQQKPELNIQLQTEPENIAESRPDSPDVMSPASPRLQEMFAYHFNPEEDSRVVIEPFSKAGCAPHASDWRSFGTNQQSKYEWRLIVFPHSGAESISAYIDIRAKDPKDDKWTETVSASIILTSVDGENNQQVLPARYPFKKVFKASKPRKGFPLLTLLPIVTKSGFIVSDCLCVCATAVIRPSSEEKPRKLPETVDAMEVQIHGFLAFDAHSSNSMIVSPWRKLGNWGLWRSAIYPIGSKGHQGFVCGLVSFKPNEEVSKNRDWHLRVLCQASVASKSGAKNASEACIAVLDSQTLAVPLNNIITVGSISENADDYLKWDPECPDNDTLRVNVFIRTSNASGPKAFVDKQVMGECVDGVESCVKRVTEALDKDLKPLVDAVNKSSCGWNKGMKELEEAFKKQLDILASLGNAFDYKDKLDELNRKVTALQEEKDLCVGKGLNADDLDAKELEMKSTLKKLLLIQTMNSAGANPNTDNTNKEKKSEVMETENPKDLVEEIPKSPVEPKELISHNVELLEKLQTIAVQCERAGELSRALCGIRAGMEKYMAEIQQLISEQAKQHAEFVEKEKVLQKKCEEIERECQILRGDDALLKTLSPEEVNKYVDFVMEAVGQVAVAKYLTKK